MENSTRRTDGQTGFTLVECVTAVAIVGVLAATAIPSLQNQQLRTARIDGIAALARVQAEQEKHRQLHGWYASELSSLRGVAANSEQGRYTLQLSSSDPQSYRAIASAKGQQLQDRACPALTLEVNSGFPQHGPSGACWNR